MSAVEIERPALDAPTARALVDSIKADVEQIGERIVTAYLGRAWLALGYADWDALCESEFDGARLRIPREQRAEQVQSLRASGLSTRAIGSALGVDHKTVVNDLRTGGELSPPAAAPITGTDGKTYPSSQPVREKTTVRDSHSETTEILVDPDTGEVVSAEPTLARTPSTATKRRPLPLAFEEQTQAAARAVSALTALLADDRFTTNAEQVATRNRGDLLRVAEALAGVLNRLSLHAEG